jgi:hypothetical protein
MAIDEKIAHLGFIQAVINRMGNNSFLVKGWTVVLVAAIFALAAKDSNSNFVFIALVPIFAFWGLDAYYLHQERLFRGLYEVVADGRIKSNNFTMSTESIKVATTLRIAFTLSVWPFYLLIILMLVIVAIKSWANIHWHFI